MTDLATKQKVRLKIIPALIVVAGIGLIAVFGFVLLKKQVGKKVAAPFRLPNGQLLSTLQQPSGTPAVAPAQVLVKFKPDADVIKIVAKVIGTNEQTVVLDQQQRLVYDDALKNELSHRTVSGYTTAKVKPTLKAITELPKLLPRTKLQTTNPKRARRTTTVAADTGLDRWRVIEVNEATADVRQLVDSFKAEAGVEAAEPNYVVKIAYLPNDYYLHTDLATPPVHSWGQNFPDLWGIKRIGSEAAWAREQGKPSSVIAVIDTGVDVTHEDLAANVWKNSGEDANGNCILDPGEDLNGNGMLDSGETCNGHEINGIDDDENGYIDDVYGGNGVDYKGDIHDTHGHGTHVSGTIAGQMDNTVGVSGVCGHCRIMPFVAIPGGGGYDTWIIAGIRYAVNNGADVINMSIGGPFSQAEEDAVNEAVANGVVVVAAAGNENSNTPSYPGAFENAIGVAAIQYGDGKASFSNFGDWVDVAAPGVDTLSLKGTNTSMCSANATVGGVYCHVSGTSMASPHVAGLAGLMLSINPALTANDVRTVLENSTEDFTSPPFSPGFDPYSGFGLINADAATAIAEELQTTSRAELSLRNVQATFLWPDRIRVTGKIFNTGFLSTGGAVAYDITDGGVTVASGTTPGALLPNGSIDVSLDFTGSGDTPYLFRVDPANLINEYNETNNTFSAQPLLASIPGWPRNINNRIDSAPTVADLDGDGQQETIVADRLGTISVFRSDGSNYSGYWPVVTAAWNKIYSDLGSVTVADFDPTNNGLEILYVDSMGKYHALHKDGTRLDGWPRWPGSDTSPAPYIDRIQSYITPTLADINGDGLLEVLGTSFWFNTQTGAVDRGDLVALRYDGVPVPGWETIKSFSSGAYATTAPSVADVRPDIPGLEVFVGASDGKVYAWQADGTPLAGWPALTAPGYSIRWASVALADVSTASPGLEVVVPAAHVGQSMGKMFAWRADGTVLNDGGLGWPRVIGYQDEWSHCLSPAITDIDPSYPGPEIVGSCGYVMKAWHSDGVPVTGWDPPLHVPFFDEKIWGEPSVADLDGDGSKEVIIGPTSLGRILIWRWNGQPFASVPIRVSPGTYLSTTPVADVNGDGVLEIVVASTGGTIYAWPMQNVSPETPLPWPRLHHDPQNTGEFDFTMASIPNIDVVLYGMPVSDSRVQGTLAMNARVMTNGYTVNQVTFVFWGQTVQDVPAHATPCSTGQKPHEKIPLATTLCYTATIDTLTIPDGGYAVQARVITTSPIVATSPWTSFTVDNIPFTLTFDSPAANAFVRGAVNLQATPSMPVVDVNFSVDEEWVGIDFEGPAPYSTTWDTSGFTDGTHVIRALAHELNAGEFVGATVSVTVDNTVPTIPANLRRTSTITLAPTTEPIAHRSASGVMVAGVTLARVEQTPGDGGGGGGTTKSFTLGWDVATDTGSGIAGYRLYSCAGATCTPSIRQEVGNMTTFNYTGASIGVTLNFEVTAVDKAGNESARSNRLMVAVAQ